MRDSGSVSVARLSHNGEWAAPVEQKLAELRIDMLIGTQDEKIFFGILPR